jgi:hypothetical protein
VSSVTQGAKPEGAGQQQGSEVKEPFMQRWFGWGNRAEEKFESTTQTEKRNKEAAKHENRSHRTFSESERLSIRDYYRNENTQQSGARHKEKKKKKLPPGLQKKLARGGELPPGWQTKVSRGEVLDEELLSHAYLLPDELRRALPPLEYGTEMRRIGDRIVRVVEGNGTVIDVIDLADIVLRQ